MQEALRELSASTCGIPGPSQNSWSMHPQVPDMVLQQGTGPHAVTFENTGGNFPQLVTDRLPVP